LSNLQISNPKEAILNSGLKTIEDVLKIKNLPSIGKMALSNNKMKLLIIKWLMEVNEFMNLKKGMTEAQIILAATTILEDYDSLNTADLALFFKNLINGKYGNMFESFNNQKLCDALDLYVESRLEHAVSKSQSRHNRFTSQDIQSTFLEDKKREKKRSN
tara:strand:- start:711 stop:1190 length:480 start_codon:yes stop_codon:yes gene_type:complete